MHRLFFPVLLAAMLIISGCAGTSGRASKPVTVTTVTVTAKPTLPPKSSASPAAPSANPTASGANLAPEFARWATSVPGRVAVSVAAVGSNTTSDLLAADQTDVAWSTIKVPLALAVVRQGSDSMASTIESALTQSDNSAAEQLWSSLGPPSTAAALVDDVLRTGGDATTEVESRRLRAGFTSFGQTRWALPAQAHWIANLPCLPDSKAVLDPMRDVVASQRWGFGVADDAAIKGGWGPDTSGGYLVRQMGVLTSDRGATAVAVSARPDDGTFASGTQILTSIARWLMARQSRLPAGTCR